MRISLFLLFIFSLPGSTSHASLGGDEETIKTEVSSLHLQRTLTSNTKYSLHSLTGRGLKLHQFMGSNHKVFAIAWQGKTHPDFSVVMGTHLPEFEQALAQSKQSNSRQRARGGPINVDVGDFHLEMGGHMMAVSGRAWITSQLPRGVEKNELH